MDRPVSERRAHRRAADDWARAARASLRPGCPVAIVNISSGGALVESTRPVRPGTRVLLQIATRTSALGLSARVLRCDVRLLTRNQGVVYGAALRFDDRAWASRELGTLAG